MRHSCGDSTLLSQSLLCSPFSWSGCYQPLASCSSLTSLTIDLPDGHQELHHGPLSQLTSLRKLTLCYGVCAEGPPWQVGITGLARLTNLRWLTVKGFVPPASEEQQQQQQRCLPTSLMSLIIEGAQQLDEEEAKDSIESWLQHAAGCRDLQQLQLIDLYSGAEGWQGLDFGGFAHLKELRFVNSPSRQASMDVYLPVSITKLTDLEVLWLETLGSSRLWTYQYYWGLDSVDMELLMSISEQCPMLRELGPLCDWEGKWDITNVLVPQPFKHLSRLVLQEGAPHWLDHTRCPSLVNLTIEVCKTVSDELLQQLAQLTGLTFLQLNAAVAYAEKLIRPTEGWAAQLDRLGAGLCNLQRLELVNHFSEPATPQQRFPPLSMPHLSAFTQLKQLRLACAVNRRHPLPEQPTAADLLRGLSGLTQLEHMELIGYVAVTPAVVCAWIERLSKLRVLEVRSCDHPEVQAVPAGDGAQGLVAAGLSGYREVQELYSQLRPKLRVEVLS